MTDHSHAQPADGPPNKQVQQLLTFVQDEVCLLPVDLQLETDLLLTGAVDSLGVIRITQWLEDEFDIEVDPVEVTLENFRTVGHIVAYSKTKGASL